MNDAFCALYAFPVIVAVSETNRCAWTHHCCVMRAS